MTELSLSFLTQEMSASDLKQLVVSHIQKQLKMELIPWKQLPPEEQQSYYRELIRVLLLAKYSSC